MAAAELVASIASPRERAGTDLRPYDSVCLGNPYCRRVRGNYAEDLALLREAVPSLRAEGKKVYVTSPAAPRGRDLPHVERLISAAAEAGADAIEIHNMGVLRILREKGSPLPAHIGAYANVYTHLTARVMRDYGAVRVSPNAEVSIDEMGIIAREGGVEVELLAHGKIPLGITERCSLLAEDENSDPNCPSACEEEQWLTTRQWVLKTVGKGVLSGRDMCMLEHVPALLAGGFTVFRVEGLYETSACRSETGKVYREALELAASGRPYEVRPEWAAVLRKHSREGFCNGYYFGKTGRIYVGSVLQEGKS